MLEFERLKTDYEHNYRCSIACSIQEYRREYNEDSGVEL